MTLELDLPQALGARATPAAVEQILFNLFDNACKYAGAAEDRRIHVTAERDRRGRILVRVADHGPGIPQEARRKLFRAFGRSARDAAGRAPGVGLGLALARRLARSMGGDLVLEDRDGGASFALILRSRSV
jgi:signal transduction histidine kinase